MIPTATPEPACSTEDGELVADLFDEYAQEWDDTFDIATSTSRIALSGPVQDLQRIRRDIQNQEWPECAGEAHDALISMMNSIIEGFLAFMSDEPDATVNAHFERAGRQQEDFVDAVADLRLKE